MAPLVLLGCLSASASQPDAGGSTAGRTGDAAAPTYRDPVEARGARARLIHNLAREINDQRVLTAMSQVPRHLFVPEASIWAAYQDAPLPIGYGQTISQPTVVAVMSEALQLRGSEKVLEIGTGSGYQAAILSLLASEVYSIELIGPLADEAARRVAKLGYANVHVRVGDGYKGWPAQAPFDRILLTAAPEEVPQTLFDELRDGGVLVAPVGPNDWAQSLLRFRKKGRSISREDLGPVQFVPMIKGD